MIKGVAAQEIFIAGIDKRFYPAKVKIKANKIIISNTEVKIPARHLEPIIGKLRPVKLNNEHLANCKLTLSD